MNDIFNPSPTAPVATHSDAFNLPRFSNNKGLGDDTSGSGAFNWDNVNDWVDSVANIITGVWGTGDKHIANAYQIMYNQERKTTNLLIGIVVAFVLLAFAFLIIKKK